MAAASSTIKFRIVFVIFWVMMFTDQVLVLNYFGLPWKESLIDSGISNFWLLLLSLLIINTLRFYLPRGNQYINIFSICLFLSIFWLVVTRFILKLSLGYYEGYRELLQSSLSIRYSIGFLVLGCVTMIGILWFNQKEQHEYEKRKSDAEKLAKEAELFKLRQQLQPHFLFNSLNSINALIGTRPEEARKMVHQLSDFLRGTIKKEETQWVSLREELQYLQLYLEIEKVRFGNRLATEVHIDDDTLTMKLPALLLQPVVENAIKFGLYDTTGDTVIRLYAKKINEQLDIRVINPFDPETSSPQQGTGFGLKSVQRRLYLLFARTDLLNIEREASGEDGKHNIFITHVKIPQPAL